MNKLFKYFSNKYCISKIFFITFVAITSVISPVILAQEHNGDQGKRRFDRETFLIKRSAFLTAELALTPEEAADFIPLCEELQRKKFEVGQACRQLSKEIRSIKDPTDADYTKVIDECLGVGLKEAQLEKEYYEKFKNILPPEKLYKYKDAEYKFARDFMKGSGKNEIKQK